MIYTILTSLIILLGKLRSKFGSRALRLDRATPWNQGTEKIKMQCGDCRTKILFVVGHSMTPVRPLEYSYKLRLGSMARTEPDPSLIGKIKESLSMDIYLAK